MNITEANATAGLLEFVAGIQLFEHIHDELDGDRITRDARYLAERAYKVIGAGPLPDDVEYAVAVLFEGVELADPDRPVADVPVAGGRL